MSDPTRSETSRRELHAIIQMAQADLQADPNNQQAADAMAGALDELRTWAGSGGAGRVENVRANIRENLAAKPSRLQTFAGRALNTLSPLGDEVRGVAEVARRGWSGRPGVGEAFREGEQAHREASEALRAANPGTAKLGDISGTVGNMALLGSLRLPVRGALGPAGAQAPSMGQGIRQGAHLAGRAGRAMLEAGKLGAAEGALQGVAGEGSFGERLEAGGTNAALYGLTSAALVGGGQALGRRFAARRADQMKKAADVDLIPIERAGAQARLREADAIARRNQLQIEALERSALDFEERRAARLAQQARAEAAARRASEAHAERLPRQTRAERRAEEAARRASESHAGRQNVAPATPDTPDQVAITRMRREAMERKASAPAPGSPEWVAAKQAELRRAPPSSVAQEHNFRQSAPEAPPAVGEPQMPGRALHDVQGNPIPGTEVSGRASNPFAPTAEEAAARAAAATTRGERAGDYFLQNVVGKGKSDQYLVTWFRNRAEAEQPLILQRVIDAAESRDPRLVAVKRLLVNAYQTAGRRIR